MKAQNSIDSSSIGTDKQDPLRIVIFGDISVKIDNLLPIYDSDNKTTLRNIDILQEIAQDFDVREQIKADARLIYLDCPDQNIDSEESIITYIINKIKQKKPDFLNHKGEQVEVVLCAHGGISDNGHQIKLNGHRHNTLELITNLQKALADKEVCAGKFLLLSCCSGQISIDMEKAIGTEILPSAETVVITQNQKSDKEISSRAFFMLLDLLRFVGKYSLINAIFNALNYDYLEDLIREDFKNEFSISQVGKDGFKRIEYNSKFNFQSLAKLITQKQEVVQYVFEQDKLKEIFELFYGEQPSDEVKTFFEPCIKHMVVRELISQAVKSHDVQDLDNLLTQDPDCVNIILNSDKLIAEYTEALAAKNLFLLPGEHQIAMTEQQIRKIFEGYGAKKAIINILDAINTIADQDQRQHLLDQAKCRYEIGYQDLSSLLRYIEYLDQQYELIRKELNNDAKAKELCQDALKVDNMSSINGPSNLCDNLSYIKNYANGILAVMFLGEFDELPQEQKLDLGSKLSSLFKKLDSPEYTALVLKYMNHGIKDIVVRELISQAVKSKDVQDLNNLLTQDPGCVKIILNSDKLIAEYTAVPAAKNLLLLPAEHQIHMTNEQIGNICQGYRKQLAIINILEAIDKIENQDQLEYLIDWANGIHHISDEEELLYKIEDLDEEYEGIRKKLADDAKAKKLCQDVLKADNQSSIISSMKDLYDEQFIKDALEIKRCANKILTYVFLKVSFDELLKEQKLDLGSKLSSLFKKLDSPEYAALVLKYMNPADEFLSQYIKSPELAPSENEQIIEHSSEHQMKFGGDNLEENDFVEK